MARKIKNKTTLRKKQIISLFLLHYFKHLSVVLAIIILLFGLFYVIRPKYTTMNKAVEDDRKKKEAEIQKIKNYLDKIENLKNKFDSIPTEEVKRINQMIPSDKDPEVLFPEIESLVGNLGTVTSIEINKQDTDSGGEILEKLLQQVSKKKSDKKKVNPLGKINIKLQISGLNYTTFKKLLSHFEENLRLMDVNSVNFSPDGKSVSLDITTYYLK